MALEPFSTPMQEACDDHDRHMKAHVSIGAIKADKEKTRLDLIPPELISAVGRVLTFGSVKYSERNWEKGMAWGRVFGALMRHMWAWWGGEKQDPETGMSHLWHAGCCIAFLISYEERGIGTDDRKVQEDGDTIR